MWRNEKLRQEDDKFQPSLDNLVLNKTLSQQINKRTELGLSLSGKAVGSILSTTKKGHYVSVKTLSLEILYSQLIR